MALYKQLYHDVHIGPATYDITGKETKNVDGQSKQDYKGGMKLTVGAGQLEFRAAILRDISLMHSDIDWNRSSSANVATISSYGVNLNAYGVFHLAAGLSAASGMTVTSCGIALWGNYHLLQVLVTMSAKKFSNTTKNERSPKRNVLSAIKFITVNKHNINAARSNTT
ncbi:hypothetical protein ACVFVO_09010 [Advenella kashmirensis]